MADLRGCVGHAPHPNSFNFMQFLGKFGKIVCWRLPGGLAPHLGEILDPPLTDLILTFLCKQQNYIIILQTFKFQFRTPTRTSEQAGANGICNVTQMDLDMTTDFRDQRNSHE